jgi:hypothetical protein
VHKLLRIKPIENISKYACLISSSLTFWTHLHHLACFCKSFEKIFSNTFVNSQWNKNMISKSIFQDFENYLPVSNAFPLAK